ncbi:SET and MYND domain-containing protein 4-like [Aphidius gifuensis]|uniref:SET and MYND domain-containing protein 4-like n=1 Tax=Aphidius gifuensis TaxID=684658 RepID=UPI001CDD4531|nr:SET and MYND domain-containing protein 4-like [Aphidius gifuensis]
MESRTKEKYDDGGGGGGDNAKWTIDMIKTIMLDLSNNSKLKDEKRIKKILEDLNNGSSGWIIPTPIIESKNALKSIAHRNEGNDYFKSNDLDKACEAYTKSVAWAKANSEELAMAYANRSAVLLKAKLISYCLDDIQRALDNGYPDRLKSKLYFRQATCLRILNADDNCAIDEALSQTQQWIEKMNEKDQLNMNKMLKEFQATKTIDKTNYKWDYQGIAPKLKGENPMIPGLSDAVTLKYSDEFGRHMIATKDIKPGDVLSVQKPYASIINASMKYELCWHCGKQTWSGLPCNNCPDVIFCSKTCQQNSNDCYHDIECNINKKIKSFGLPNSLSMGVRLTIMALKESNNCVEILKDNIDKINQTSDPLTKGFTNGKLDPDKYASVYSLISHCYKNLEKESTSLVGCIITGYFLMQTNKAIENCSGNLKLLKENELFVFIVGLIERNNWIMAVNIFEAGFFTDGQDALPSMTVIAPGASFYNHSCNPMINRNICGGYMISTAICPIKKGQQIFETYGEAYFTEEKKERQVYLNDHHFICKCEACINNWPIPVNIDISKVTPDHEISRVEIVKLSREISQLSSISYDFYRENNKIKDISESLNEGIRLAVVLRQLFKQNSLEVVETIRVLMRIIRLATMVPFVSLQK